MAEEHKVQPKKSKLSELYVNGETSPIGSRFSREEQKSFSHNHYKRAIRKAKKLAKPLISPHNLLIRESPTKRHYNKIKKSRKNIAHFVQLIYSIDENSSLEQVKLIEQEFYKLMYSINEVYQEDGDDFPSSEIKSLVKEFLLCLFKTSNSPYEWSNLSIINTKIESSHKSSKETDEWKGEILKLRNYLVDEIIRTFGKIICWHKKYLQFIILPVEISLFSLYYNNLFEYYNTIVTVYFHLLLLFSNILIFIIICSALKTITFLM